jgi:hypothetical protein
MNEVDPNDKKLIATEYFDGALDAEELKWFESNEMGSDPVGRAGIEQSGKLRAFVRGAPQPEPPHALDHYWQQVRGRMAGTRGAFRWPAWLDLAALVPGRAVAVAALVVTLGGVWLVTPRVGHGIPRIERAEARQPGLYTSVVAADRASVIWIEGLEYLPPEFVLR